MPRGGPSSTGGNMEPMPFVRKWGGKEEVEDADETGPLPPPPVDFGMAPLPDIKPKLELPYGDSEQEEHHKNGAGRERSPERPGSRSRSHKRSRSPRKRSRSRKRDKDRKRSRSHEKKKKRKRSRSRDKHRRKASRSRSRSGSRSRDRKKHRRDSRSRSRSRGRDRSRSRDRDDRKDSSQPDQKPTTPVPIDPASKLPPAIRGTMIAQSLLAKPEALPRVIESVAESAAALGLAPSAKSSDPLQSAGTSEPTKRVRKSRWSTTKSFVPGMPTILPSDLDEDQRQAYLLNLEVEESTRKLRIGDFSAPADPNERSPSPEPVYDSNGKRLNTREVRKRQELEQLRHEKIQGLLRINPNYKPPADYRVPNIRFHDKVWIPQEDHPEINFVGLLIGPRGNTLRALEQETGAKIVIRGKGSVKEGKFGRRDGPLPGENEPLHAYVTSNDSQAIKRAVERIKEIVNAALLIPDGQNELRKLQLRELAILNGTMRPEDILGGTRCSNCGSDQHKSWECPEQQNVTASIVCTACGGAGHIARDCINPRAGFQYDGGVGMDEEYSALMAELGERPAPGTYDPGVKTEPGVPKFSLQAQQKQQDRKFTLPSGAPIMRVNLANPSKNAQPLNQVGGAAPGGGDAASYAGWGYGGDMSAYYGYGDPSQMPPSAWGAPPPSGWSYPVPVPPPPPPPPVPAAMSSAGASSSDDWSNLLAPPAPPPPPS